MGGLKHWRLDYVWYGSSDTRMLSRKESGNHYLTAAGTAVRTWIPSKSESISLRSLCGLCVCGELICKNN